MTAAKSEKGTRARVIDALKKQDRAQQLYHWSDHKTQSGDHIGGKMVRHDATKLREEADQDLSIWAHTTRNPKRGNGGEWVPMFEPENPSRRDYKRDVVEEKPDVLAHQASSDAMELAAKADLLPAALDMANSIEARNRAEKLLAHEAVAMHSLGMSLVARAQNEISRAESGAIYGNAGQRQAANVEAARLTNAAARAMSSYQEALLTLQKLRTGGKQVVTVQHVTITDGGQAVVAQTMNHRGRTGGRRRRGRTAIK